MLFSVAVLIQMPSVEAQVFNSGSTGADGPLAPTANMAVTLPPDGILNYTTVTIPAGVTVTFIRNVANTPVTMLATGDVTIAGQIDANGANGEKETTAGAGVVRHDGALGGPGGYSGGHGGLAGAIADPIGNNGHDGQGPGGGTGGKAGPPPVPAKPGDYGAPSSYVELVPLLGGSGGGGGPGRLTVVAGSGGGGGGAIVISSSTKISVSGSILANGGSVGGLCDTGAGGGGSGGAIRLVAPEVLGAGSLQAIGQRSCVELAKNGRIRIESFSPGFTGSSNPPATFSTSPRSAVPLNLPTLKMTSVGGKPVPANATGSYKSADVSLDAGTANPVPVTLTATNTPVGTRFTVKLYPQGNAASSAASAPSTGTLATSTATALVTFPDGEVSRLIAFGSFTIAAQTAALYPLIDGEPVYEVVVTAALGEPSTLTLVTESGKSMRIETVFPEGGSVSNGRPKFIKNADSLE